MNQKQKYQEKLEQRSSGIRVCQSMKGEIIEAMKNSTRDIIISLAEQLNYFARCSLKERIGGITNFHGFQRYSYQILTNIGVYYTK